MDSLTNLEAMYGNHKGKVSDKWTSYFACYDRVFAPMRADDVRLLEIGVQNGGSLEIWTKYFPNARAVVGCDINEKCGELKFADERISVVVGDAKQSDTEAAIRKYSSEFDIIIDDGSHTSSDIIRAFLRYFPLVRDSGIFVAEDLACSYWQEYEGGLYSKTSAINFFKLLADYVNREAWGLSLDTVTFFGRSGFDVSGHQATLDTIQSIEFSPSMCVIHKARGENIGVGTRIIAGSEFPVQPSIKDFAGQELQVPTQAHNPDSAFLTSSNNNKLDNASSETCAQLYISSTNEGYSEAASPSKTYVLDGKTVTLRLPVIDTDKPVDRLRLDLADKPSAVVLHDLSLQMDSGDELWRWDMGPESFSNRRGLVFRDHPAGLLVVCLDNDPQFEVAIPEDVLAYAHSGASLVIEISGRPLLDVLPSLLEQPGPYSLSLQVSTEEVQNRLASPALVNELSETAELFRQVVGQRNSTIARQREQLQSQDATQQELTAQLQKAEAQLDVLKDFVAAAFGNTNERI